MITIDKAEADLIVQWFNAVQDLNPDYLEQPDFVIIARLSALSGRRISNEIKRRAGIDRLQVCSGESRTSD